MADRILEKLWDCSTCGQMTRIGGSQMTCPGCGAPRPEGVTFYHDDGTPREVTRPAELKVALGGADWYCKFCRSGNRNEFDSCQRCAAPRYDPDEQQSPAPRPKVPSIPKPQFRTYTETGVSYNWRAIIGVAVGIIALLGVIWLVWFLLQTTAENATVKFKEWNRSISFEHLIPVDHEGWEKPGDAYNVSSVPKYKETITTNEVDHYDIKTGTKPVQTGTIHVPATCYEDLHNGYEREYDCGTDKPVYTDMPYTESIPVYKTKDIYAPWYTYTTDDWVHSRSVPTSGTTEEPYWGDFTLAENEREQSRSESYTIVFEIREMKKVYPGYSATYEEWMALEVGEGEIVNVNALGYILSLGKK